MWMVRRWTTSAGLGSAARHARCQDRYAGHGRLSGNLGVRWSSRMFHVEHPSPYAVPCDATAEPSLVCGPGERQRQRSSRSASMFHVEHRRATRKLRRLFESPAGGFEATPRAEPLAPRQRQRHDWRWLSTTQEPQLLPARPQRVAKQPQLLRFGPDGTDGNDIDSRQQALAWTGPARNERFPPNTWTVPDDVRLRAGRRTSCVLTSIIVRASSGLAIFRGMAGDPPPDPMSTSMRAPSAIAAAARTGSTIRRSTAASGSSSAVRFMRRFHRSSRSR